MKVVNVHIDVSIPGARVQIYIKQKTNWQLLSEIDAGETSFKLKSYAAEPLMSKVVFADGSKSKSIVITK